MTNITKLLIGLLIFLPTYTQSILAKDVNEDVEDEDLQEIDDDKDKDSKDSKNKSDSKDKSSESKNNNEESTEEDSDSNKEDEEDTKKDDDKELKKKKGISSGWYSGIDFKVAPTKLIARETKPNNTTVNYESTCNLLNPSFTLGYDYLKNKLLIGGEVNAGFNFGSKFDYKDNVYDTAIAKINKSINFTGNIKLGMAFGPVTIYGKVGGDLSKFNFDWQTDDKKNTEKKYVIGWSYGAGASYTLNNSWYFRIEVMYSPKVTQADTNTQIKDCKLADTKITNYQVGLGTGYRF